MSAKRFNWQIWAGFLLSLATMASWMLVFLNIPITRNFPWANLILLGLSTWLLLVGVRRSFAPGRFRALRAIVGSVLAGLGVLVLGFFLFVVFIAARRLPPSSNAPQVGQKAPDFNLIDANNTPVSLPALFASSAGRPETKGVLLIFYMYSECRTCNSELRDIQNSLPALEANGIRPVAISTDSPDVSRALNREAGYTFTFLSDPTSDMIRRYDLADENGNARPATFLIDRTGTVRWRAVTGSMFVRTRPATVLDAAKGLQ